MRALLLLLPLIPGQGDPADALVRRLGSDHAEEREQAILGLKAMGKGALPAIQRAAADRDVEVASRARDLLRRLAIRDSFTPRLKALLPGIEDPPRGRAPVLARLARGGTEEIARSLRRFPPLRELKTGAGASRQRRHVLP